MHAFLLDLCADDKARPQFTPAIECSGKAIQQIYWYFYVRGSVIDGEFIPIGERNDSQRMKYHAYSPT
jgi:hypothetical protein